MLGGDRSVVHFLPCDIYNRGCSLVSTEMTRQLSVTNAGPLSRHLLLGERDCWVLSSRHGRHYFYVPTLRLALQIGDKCATQLIAGILPNVIAQRMESCEPDAIEPAPRTRNAFHLGLGLTQDCSLRCSYCHAEAEKPGHTAWPLLEAAIEHAVRKAALTPRRSLAVSFAVGGEPTLPWNLFRRTVERIRSVTEQQHSGIERTVLSMTTNGYYGDNKRSFIGQQFDVLTLSLDGPPEIQNLHRPTKSGGASYDVVAATCNHFLKQGKARLSLRATVSSVSVGRMTAIVEHFHSRFGEGYTITFEPLVPIGRGLQASGVGAPDIAQYTEEFLRARARGRELGLRVNVSGASLDRLTSWFCGAIVIPSFAVCLNGAVTACHRDSNGKDYRYGTLTPGMTFHPDESRLRELESLAMVPQSCGDCFAKFHCAGDCPDLRRIGISRCAFQKAVVFAQLQELFDQTEKGDN